MAEHPSGSFAAEQLLVALTSAVNDDAFITTDLGSLITSWNQGAERLYGYTETEAIGQSIAVLFPRGHANEEREIIARVQALETIRDSDAVRRRKNGTDISIALTIVPIVGADGRATGTVRLARDVTERQQADRAVRRLAAIVHSSDDAIVSKDLNGRVTSWNSAAERLFGYTAPEMIGQSIRLIIPADRQNEEDKVLGAIRCGDKVDHFETIRRRKDGSEVAVSLTVSPIFDAGGRVIGASKIARDISERLQLETDRAHALAMSEENAAITERLNRVGSIVASALDRGAIVQAVTDAATEFTGAEFGAFYESTIDDGGETCRLTCVSKMSPADLPQFPIAGGTDVFDAAFWGERPVRIADLSERPELAAGPLRLRSYMAIPVKARSGEVLGGMVFGHPSPGRFSERHERLATGIAGWASIGLENARLYVGVQEASRLKDQFIATLSHELRTPLNAILGYSRMVRAGIVTADRRQKAVETIERNATSLAQIVEDVLDVSRIISGKMRLNVQAVDVPDLVRSSVAGILPAADAKGVRIEESLDPEASPVSGDPERLQQVMWNLMTNAVKFTGRGGVVRISLKRVNSHVQLAVSDTGIGISRAFLPHLFEAFRQADAGMSRERGGLGLGLNISRQLVEMHGGTIQAASEGEGKGSRFTITLPILQPEGARAGAPSEDRIAEPDPRAELPDLRGVRILAVDDDRDALSMLQEILEAAGADVSIADSAMQALDVIEKVRPDVVVADIGMPRMDGFELIGKIRESENAAVRTVPAAALTAYARSEDRTRALRSGFQVHLAKPIDPGQLMTMVSALVKR